MKLTQLDKNMGVVLANIRNNNVHFMRIVATYSNYQLTSKRLNKVPLEDIEEYLTDPDIILVRFEPEDA